MTTTTKRRPLLTPETAAERNVRILKNQATAARNAANAAEDTDAFDALYAAANDAEYAWSIANRALVTGEVA